MAAPLLTALVHILLVGQAPASDPPAVTVAVERRAEHYRYRFDHPSNFDTVELVPHFYEQRYDASSIWLTVGTRYRVLGTPTSTDAGVTPRITTAGSDIDTFFQPSGDVVTSGTDGRVRWSSWFVVQRFHLARSSWGTLGVVLGYRRSAADFLPDDLIVTHSMPASETRTFTTSRERTVSRLLSSGLTAGGRWAWQDGWRIETSVDLLPLIRARLVTSLPDKYANNVTNDALAFGARGSVTLEHSWPWISAGVAVTGGAARGFRASASYRERGLGLAVCVRRQP